MGECADSIRVYMEWRVKGRVYTRKRLPPHSVTALFLSADLVRLCLT